RPQVAHRAGAQPGGGAARAGRAPAQPVSELPRDAEQDHRERPALGGTCSRARRVGDGRSPAAARRRGRPAAHHQAVPRPSRRRLDVVESPRGPWVVDVNTFPGYKGVPDAASRIAQYIGAAALRAARGEPVVAAAPPVPTVPGSALKVVLNALSTTPATREELNQIRKLLDELKERRERA